MEELAVLVGVQPTPLLPCALWHMPFLILENMCPLYTQKVLDARSGLATLVVPAVQWTTKGSAHVSCKELNKCNLCGEVLLLLRTFFCFFLWHRNIIFHCFVKNTSFKLRDSAFCLDRTFIRTIRTAGWPGSAGLVTEHRWYVWVRGVFFLNYKVQLTDKLYIPMCLSQSTQCPSVQAFGIKRDTWLPEPLCRNRGMSEIKWPRIILWV